ncbi:hypothetical protein D7D52_20250 [Nocardia yunnanensis]|uniref:Uncharacterized protein n=1 Tax=Nocardia yunnanensis TaxID=2382165 RepID=A0A386ZF85_9NOCA|nr:hypothetical protein [Nocardia yunnanensis]AYF75784.1 hypothetical protein D7D52_20250 [Nocardia yunnanensis]
MVKQPFGHDVPDHPVLNLTVARRGLAAHDECGDECEAKRYFARQVPYLEGAGHRERGQTSWNIWASGEDGDEGGSWLGIG